MKPSTLIIDVASCPFGCVPVKSSRRGILPTFGIVIRASSGLSLLVTTATAASEHATMNALASRSCCPDPDRNMRTTVACGDGGHQVRWFELHSSEDKHHRWWCARANGEWLMANGLMAKWDVAVHTHARL